jgi:hypothetical protein
LDEFRENIYRKHRAIIEGEALTTARIEEKKARNKSGQAKVPPRPKGSPFGLDSKDI